MQRKGGIVIGDGSLKPCHSLKKRICKKDYQAVYACKGKKRNPYSSCRPKKYTRKELEGMGINFGDIFSKTKNAISKYVLPTVSKACQYLPQAQALLGHGVGMFPDHEVYLPQRGGVRKHIQCTDGTIIEVPAGVGPKGHKHKGYKRCSNNTPWNQYVSAALTDPALAGLSHGEKMREAALAYHEAGY